MPDEKMKYPLLEFEYDKKLYEELLTLNPHPEFMDRVSIVTEDYEHDDFIRINRITISAGVSGLLLSFCSAAVSCIMPQKASFSKTFCHKLPDFT